MKSAPPLLRFLALGLSLIAAAWGTPPAPLAEIRVHSDGHYLETAEGRPFFWLGDTAWKLTHATTRDECSYYLSTRARQATPSSRRMYWEKWTGSTSPRPTG